MKTLILLFTLAVSMIAQAQDHFFTDGKLSGRAQIERLVQLNSDANRIFEYNPSAYSTGLVESNFQLQKILIERLNDSSFEKEVIALRTQLAQFLSSGGVLFVETPKAVHKQAGLNVFAQLGPINPLLLVLTRSIGFGAMDALTDDLSGITKHAWIAVGMGATGVLAFPALFYFKYMKGKIEAKGDKLQWSRLCALSSLYEQQSTSVKNCEDDPEIVAKISDFRALGASARLYQLLKSVQDTQGLSIFYGVNLSINADSVQLYPLNKVDAFVHWIDKAVDYRAFHAFVDLGMMTDGHNEFKSAIEASGQKSYYYKKDEPNQSNPSFDQNSAGG